MTGFWKIALPALAFCFAVGCGSSSDDISDEGLVKTSGTASGGEVKLEEVKSDGTATITGTVTYDGTPPEMGVIPGINAVAYCMQGEIHNQTWVVDPASKGVANVVVWVNPPKGQLFKKPEQKTWPDAVEVDQPFCAFVPHVVILYPTAFNGTKMEETGQVLRVKNGASIAHNIRVTGSPQKNPARGGTLTPKSQGQDFNLRLEDKQEVSLNCDIHKWMTGYAITLDHPYAAVTDKDGKFTIKNVPAGADIAIMSWHEALKKFSPEVAGGTKVKLTKGETKDASFKIHAK